MKTIIIEDHEGEVLARVTIAQHQAAETVDDITQLLMDKGAGVRDGE